MGKNGFKKHLPAIFLREFFHVCIINKKFQLFEKLTRANQFQIEREKPYDYLY